MRTRQTILIKNIHNDPKKIAELGNSIIRKFTMVESLEQMFITGELVFEDNYGIVEKLPITGNEQIEINFIQETEKGTTPTKRLEKTIIFEIFKISRETGVNARTNLYTFSLVEEGFFNLLGISYSQSFSNVKVSEIISSILNHQLDFKKKKITFTVEETIDRINFIIPYWKPTTSIRYLTKIARRSKYPQEGGFIFYSSLGKETSKTTIKSFTSIATLLEQKPNVDESEKFYYKVATVSSEFINTVIAAKTNKFINREDLKNGVQGKTFYGIDFLNDKNIIMKEKGISDFIKRNIFLGSNLHLPNSIENKKAQVTFKGYHQEGLLEAESDYFFRMSFESAGEDNIYCNGNMDRYAGKMIYIAEGGGSSADAMYNEKRSGTWLIKKIVHHFVRESYEQKITIVKDATFDSDQQVLNKLEPKKKNV